MYYLNVVLTVKNEADIPAVRDGLQRTGEQSRKEAGCERWEAYQSQADPKMFLLVERWASKEHLDAHRNGPAVQQIYFKEVVPKVDRVPHPCDLVY